MTATDSHVACLIGIDRFHYRESSLIYIKRGVGLSECQRDGVDDCMNPFWNECWTKFPVLHNSFFYQWKGNRENCSGFKTHRPIFNAFKFHSRIKAALNPMCDLCLLTNDKSKYLGCFPSLFLLFLLEAPFISTQNYSKGTMVGPGRQLTWNWDRKPGLRFDYIDETLSHFKLHPA